MNGRDRINTVTAGAIIAFALVIDLLQIFLTVTIVGTVASFFVGLIANFILWLIFLFHHVSYSGNGALKKIGVSIGGAILEMVPFLDAFPFTTIGAIIIILDTKKEDRERRAKHAADTAAQGRAQQQAQNEQRARALQAANDADEMRAAA